MPRRDHSLDSALERIAKLSPDCAARRNTLQHALGQATAVYFDCECAGGTCIHWRAVGEAMDALNEFDLEHGVLDDLPGRT